MKRTALSALILLVFSQAASAHYLWVTIDPKAGDNGMLNVYFEGGPGPGDGQYLDPFIKRGQHWVRGADSKKATELKLDVVKKPKQRWLSKPLDVGGERAVESYGKWGVYAYGGVNHLLHYYARLLDVKSASSLAALSRAEHLKFDIVPKVVGDGVQLQVLFDGKPVAGRKIDVRGPRNFKETLTTDKEGNASLNVENAGRYRMKTTYDQDIAGEFEGKEYKVTRHTCSLILNLPVAAAE